MHPTDLPAGSRAISLRATAPRALHHGRPQSDYRYGVAVQTYPPSLFGPDTTRLGDRADATRREAYSGPGDVSGEMMHQVPPPVVQTVVRFGDWLAACDNTRSCEALSWPAIRPGDGPVSLSLSRRSIDAPPRVTVSLEPSVRFVAGSGSSPTVGARQPLRDAARTVALRIDGQRMDVDPRISGGWLIFSAAEQHTLWRSLPQGGELVVSDGEGRVLGRVSLAGLGAAMAAIAEAQTQDPTSPVIRQPPPNDTPADTVSSAELAPLLSAYGCRAADEVQTYRLDADHSLALPLLRCDARAEPELRAAFVLGPEGSLSQALFLEPGALHAGVRGPLSNVGWDGSDRRLSVFLEHAGEARCGVSLTYVWDGKVLAAAERRELGACTGFRRTLTTWRADVAPEVGTGE